MIARSFLGAALALGVGILTNAAAETTAPDSSSPPAAATPALPKPLHLAPFEERLAAAKSVKVQTTILGIGLDSSLGAAHAKLDSLCDATHPPKKESDNPDEEAEAGQKVLWQLAKTDYSWIFVKTDEKERITYLLAGLRSGREIPFDKIGEVKKAPIATDRTVAWDVVRPGRPLVRVVAQGAGRKAGTITIFVVKRPQASDHRG